MLKIIAEIGFNHNGNVDYIPELIRQAAMGGADYAKFQLYDSQKLFGDDSRKQNEFTFEAVQAIKETCDYYGIEFFASVFDEERLEWCEKLGVKLYKIASRTLKKDHELCKEIIETGKPVLASLGMVNVDENIPFIECDNVNYFNCVSRYPTNIAWLNAGNFYFDDKRIGWSDHCYGILACLYAIAQGAQYIEKHFTLSKTMSGHDHIGSMDLNELKVLNEYGRELSRLVKNVSSI